MYVLYLVSFLTKNYFMYSSFFYYDKFGYVTL